MKPDHRFRHGHAVTGPGHSNNESPTYRVWRKMRARCDNPKNDWYHRYGGRGIKYATRWRKFENFLADMGVRPPGKTLDRIDNDGDYTKKNCRWATPLEQARTNRRVIDTPKGPMTLQDAAAYSGLDYYTLRYRLRQGWATERLFDRPYKWMHGEARGS